MLTMRRGYERLSEFMLDKFREYYKVYRSKTFLLEAANRSAFAEISIQSIFKNAIDKSNVVTPNINGKT